MTIASGMVTKIVKVPHSLSASALTTMMPSPAMAMTRMKKMATAAATPASGPTSDRAMSPSDRPPRRVEAHSQNESCTAPARQTPAISQIRPGI